MRWGCSLARSLEPYPDVALALALVLSQRRLYRFFFGLTLGLHSGLHPTLVHVLANLYGITVMLMILDGVHCNLTCSGRHFRLCFALLCLLLAFSAG